MIYNIVLVSGVQQSDSVIHTHTHKHTHLKALQCKIREVEKFPSFLSIKDISLKSNINAS